MLKRIATSLFGASVDSCMQTPPPRPKARLGCERFEDRINPAGWLDDYASYFPDIGLGEHVLYPVVNLVFSDDTLANATDTQLAVGTAGVVVVAVVGAEVGAVAVTGTSIGGLITGGGAAAATTTTVAVAGSSAEVTTAGGVATVEIGFLESTSSEFMAAVMNAARSQGARAVVLETGPVVNADLAIKLGIAASRGRTILGGVVELVPGPIGAGTAPLFRIVWQSIPAV